MKRVWWVRHGPTHQKAMVGWSDVPADLSDTGKLARLRAILPVAPVISSDLARARMTADAIEDNRPRLPHDPNLREIHFGAWELRRFDEVEAETPDLIRDYWDKPGDIAPPGGESWNTVRDRVTAATDRVMAMPGPDVIIVAHMGAILTQVQRALAITALKAFSHRVDPLSVTCLAYDGHWRLQMINHDP